MKSVVLTFLGLICYSALHAQPYLLEETPNLKSQSQEIRSITETPAKELWVAFNKGVYQKTASGYRYHAVDSAVNSSGVYAPIEIKVLAHVQNTVWVGSENHGAYFWLNGQWVQIDTADGLPDNQINAIEENDSGNVWLATANGIAQYSSTGSISNHFPYSSNNNILCLAFSNGRLYVSNDSYADPNMYYQSGTWSSLPSASSGVGPNRATKLLISQSGELLALSKFSRFLYALKSGSWVSLGNDQLASVTGPPAKLLALSYSGNNFSRLGQNGLEGFQSITLESGLEMTLIENAQSSGYWLGGENNGSPVVLFYQPGFHSFAQLEVNDLIAGFFSGGDLFQNPNSFDFEGRQARLNLFHPDSAAMAYSGHLWLGHQQKAAAHTYGQLGRDFMSGPVSNQYDSTYLRKYDHVWKVSKRQIQNHRDSTYHPDYTMPHGIARWPAHGDPSRGEAANLAPFVDYNGNGEYEPMLGDHPHIKGDVAIYFIFNDERWLHSKTFNSPLGVEVHGMAYAYDTTDANLQKTIFLTYRIFNRSGQNMNDLKAGIWLDFDLGSSWDDFVASDSANNLMYVMNADNFDDGVNGFGANPPALGVTSLSENLKGAISYYGQNTPGIPAAMTHPAGANDILNFLQPLWKDGTPIYVEKPNGDGHSATPINTPTTNFLYNNWYPVNSQAGDLKSLAIFNDATLGDNQSHCIELALVYGRAAGGIFASATQMKANVQGVKQFYQQQTGSSCLETVISASEVHYEAGIHLYPNPAHSTLHLEFTDKLELQNVTIYSLAGQKVLNAGAQSTLDVSALKPGVYLLRCQSNKGTFTDRFLKL